jgi:hypothetical protein
MEDKNHNVKNVEVAEYANTEDKNHIVKIVVGHVIANMEE